MSTDAERHEPLLSDDVPAGRRTAIRLVGVREEALQIGRNRLVVAGLVFAALFTTLAVRLVDVTILRSAGEPALAEAGHYGAPPPWRADVLDRNGTVLATNLSTASLAADPQIMLDAPRAAEQIARILPDVSAAAVLQKLQGERSFVWLRRNLTPRQQAEINRLGMPGLSLVDEQRRVYPLGRLAAHVLGFTDIDGNGISGLEKYFDSELRQGGAAAVPLRTSIDIRAQFALREELSKSMATFNAIGAAGVVMDAQTGEVVAMSSLPDFDPNHPGASPDTARFNRASLGVYELGSVFKLFTIATGLDTGVVDMDGGYDASKPIRIARFTISDDHPKNRWLSVPEILVYSSNIGAAKMALDFGAERQRAYLERFGFLQPSPLELPEVGSPLSPQRWRDINVMTVAFGHGVAISPLQLAGGMAALVNGGSAVTPTLLKRRGKAPELNVQIISQRTSDAMRRLMRLVVLEGTGKKANIAGYEIGGKTGTAEKPGVRGYRRSALISSFVAAFPMSAPRYVVYVMLDEPHGTKETFGFATAGWTAAPLAGRVIARIAPLLGVLPVHEQIEEGRQALAISQGGRESRRETF